MSTTSGITSRTRRISAAALVLSFGLLAGCGGDGDDNGDDNGDDAATSSASASATPAEESTDDASGDYCDAVLALKGPFNAILSGDNSRASEAFDRLEEVPPTAPEEIRSEWQAFSDSFVGAKKVVESYGVDFEQFVDDRDAALAELSEEERTKMQSEIMALQPGDTDTLGDRIDDHVEDTCGFYLDETDD